jgi:hypothetical protein
MLSGSLMMSRRICLSDGRASMYAEHGEPSGEPVFFSEEDHDAFYKHRKQLLITLLFYRTAEEDVRLRRRNGEHSGKRLPKHALASQGSMPERQLSTKRQEACETGQQRQRIEMDRRQ